jgi:hypothetical protein
MAWTWSRIQPADGSYTFQPGQRYAVLASVSSDYSLDSIKEKATAQGFSITYAWEQGQPATDPFVQNLAPDPIPNHRWIFAEGDFVAAGPWALGVDSPTILFVHTTIWHIDSVFQATEGAAPEPTPTTAGLPWWGWGLALVGVGAVAWGAWTQRDVFLPRRKPA